MEAETEKNMARTNYRINIKPKIYMIKHRIEGETEKMKKILQKRMTG